jgi:hypothetical protein
LSYSAIDQLTNDPEFIARVRSCCMEQAEVYKNDARPDFVAVANDQQKGGLTYLTFVRIEGAAPGIADKVDNGDGTIDQTKVLDADLLSLTQANWQTVASLYFDEEGNPI